MGGGPRRKLVSPGSIDKFEFAALAEEIEQNYKRRSVLTAVAAAVGAVIVAKSSEEYAIAQKTFRGYYIEQKAEDIDPKLLKAYQSLVGALRDSGLLTTHLAGACLGGGAADGPVEVDDVGKHFYR